MALSFIQRLRRFKFIDEIIFVEIYDIGKKTSYQSFPNTTTCCQTFVGNRFNWVVCHIHCTITAKT